MTSFRRRGLSALLLPCAALLAVGCRRSGFPDVPEGYREFAYVSNGTSNTVSVLDLVYLRSDRTLQVGQGPSGMAVNPVKAEVYVANAQSGTLSVIDTSVNQVVATIAVGRLPYAVTVDATGRRAFVPNSGSNSVSVLDLTHRQVLATVSAGDHPGLARLSPDGHTLVVTNHGSGGVSIYSVEPEGQAGPPLRQRASFTACPGATDAVVLPDSSKAFVACSGGHQVMALGLASSPERKDLPPASDRLLALLDVGVTPVHLALKPDGGEIFVSNFGGDSISEIATGTNEVGNTTLIGNKPSRGVVSADNATLWVSNFGADSISLYSIDDGRLVGSVHTGSAPDALAFSADQHLLLAADARSGDVAVIRTAGKQGPELFTMLSAGAAPNAIVVKAGR